MDWSEPPQSVIECSPCKDLSTCVESCVDESIVVKRGWFALTRNDGTQSIFQCKQELACNGTTCNEGYEGPLCGVCNEGYNQDSNGECTSCDETTAFGVLLLVVVVLLAVLLFANIDKWYDAVSTMKTAIDLVRELELQAITKVLVATMQIVTNFAKVLSIPFPEDFQALLKLLAIFRFDISLTLGIGCLYRNSYFTSLGVSFAVVVAIAFVVGATYMYSISRADDELQLRELFEEFDKDGEGITVDAVVMMAEKGSMSASSDQIETMFADADTDKSGRMSFEEFHAAFNAHLGISEILEKARQSKARNDSLGRLFLLVFLL
jgi:hypothetical protein